MEKIWFTVLAAAVLMGGAMLLLGLGFLLSGKKLTRGCGLLPKQKGKKGENSCSLCGSNQSCDQEEQHDDSY